ncbi:MAG: hypothetical protein AAEJ57_08335, partial [Opitutales bacterium]
MRTKRFVIYWTLLVVTTLSIGAVAFLSLRREGETIRAHAEEARNHAEEARKVVVGYHEMAKHSQQMADYAEERADYAMALRARTIADNVDLLMSELKDGLMEILQSFPDEGIAKELTLWKEKNDFVGEVYLWQGDVCLPLPGQKIAGQPNLKDLPLFNQNQDWVWNTIDQHDSALVQTSSNQSFSLKQDIDSDLGTTSQNALEESKQVSGDSLPDLQQSDVSPNSQFPNIEVDARHQLDQLNEN